MIAVSKIKQSLYLAISTYTNRPILLVVDVMLCTLLLLLFWVFYKEL